METTRWNRLEYKQTGKAAFLANYWPMVGGDSSPAASNGGFPPHKDP